MRRLDAARLAGIGRSVNPDMIRLGRQARGLRQRELAKALHISASRMSKIEAGLVPTPDDLIIEISRILNYPEHFFSQAGSIAGVGLPDLFHREFRDVPQRLLDKIHARIEVSRRHVAALWQSVDVPCEFRRLDSDEYSGHVENIARMVRADWKIPRGPIADLTSVIEDAGGLVIAFDFETRRVDAKSRWFPGLPPLFFVNSLSPKDRTRFSLSHDLGHIVMHESPGPDLESEADRFAAEFLMPEEDIRADLEHVTLPRLAVLKRYWRVSMQALLKRAQSLGMISERRARTLWAQMARAGYRRREPIELDIEGEDPALLLEIIRIFRSELNYSVSDIAELLALSVQEFRETYLPQPPGPRIVELPTRN